MFYEITNTRKSVLIGERVSSPVCLLDLIYRDRHFSRSAFLPVEEYEFWMLKISIIDFTKILFLIRNRTAQNIQMIY